MKLPLILERRRNSSGRDITNEEGLKVAKVYGICVSNEI